MEFHGSDVQAAQSFYSNMFGWEFRELPEYTFPYAAIESEGENVGGMAADGQSTPQWLAYIGVSDIAAATDKAQKILPAHVQAALAQVPCIPGLLPPSQSAESS